MRGLLGVKGRRGRRADAAAGLPPASEITVRSGTYASCQQRKIGLMVLGQLRVDQFNPVALACDD
jgi:hypothetical protein